MPDSNLPRWGQKTLRGLRTLAYASLAASAWGALFYTPVGPSEVASRHAFYVWGALCLVSSLICMFASFKHRWRLEGLFVWIVGGSLSIYVSTVWSLFVQGPTRLTQAGAVTAVLVFLVIRGVELAIFAEQARRHA